MSGTSTPSSDFVSVAGLSIASDLFNFIHHELLPGTGIDSVSFWDGFARFLSEFAPRNRALLRVRDDLQDSIDRWYEMGGPATHDPAAQHEFLSAIGYLTAEPEAFEIETDDVAKEISQICGPQLVVPVDNARYAINAANARWGSLYDALYGTDAIDAPKATNGDYDPVRGKQVIDYGRAFLDEIAPLDRASHRDVIKYRVDKNGELYVNTAGGGRAALKNPSRLMGWIEPAESPSALLLENNGLHVEITINPFHPIGATDPASVCDIVLESAVTTIMDFEDSVAAVDAEDKCRVYRNWLGLCDRTLKVNFSKGGKTVERRLNKDRVYSAPNGVKHTLSGTAQMLVRNVGHLMTTPAVVDATNQECPEGLLDAYVTGAIARRQFNNRRSPVTYIVKPKMHGPEEVNFAVETLQAIEQILDIPNGCLKIGIMDEERRTSVNLRACIEAAKSRVIFINTGFLDRTGDEIHTMMKAGPVLRKGDMKSAAWMAAYEAGNVRAGLETGFIGKAQIGKGMWAMPDEMAAMLEQKIAHPKAGASTAWAPSPTAATLHALHYHAVDVKSVQANLAKDTAPASKALLAIPIEPAPGWSPQEVQSELDNNIQGILGYVVRWIQFGIGCSKVPNINGVGMMEDRATLRISSQLVANWLQHGICSRAQVDDTLLRMAAIVDEQNSSDPDYVSMSIQPDRSSSYQAARELIFDGHAQPNGYTEPILHKWRLKEKQR